MTQNTSYGWNHQLFLGGTERWGITPGSQERLLEDIKLELSVEE